MILAADIGGTKSIVALFEPDRPGRPIATLACSSGDFRDVGDILAHFLARHPARLTAACLGVAGPAVGGVVRTTNLPWVVEAVALSAQLGGVPVHLLNDLEAFAWGLAVLPPERFAVLQAGRPVPTGNAAVIAAGTGLGQAGLVWDGRRHLPFAAEGGHADFAPRTPREIELLRFLLRRWDHVSWERVVSGPGIAHLFEFLRDVEGWEVPPALAAAAGDPPDPAAISQAGLSGTAPIAVEALDLFASAYGAEAGNLALKLMATAGVYLGGGISPRLLPKLQDGTFVAAFADKGRFARLLSAVPVHVVLEESAALYGAARYAALRLAGA